MWNLKKETKQNKKITKLTDTQNSDGCQSQEMGSGQNGGRGSNGTNF